MLGPEPPPHSSLSLALTPPEMLQLTPRCNHGRSGAATASFRVAVALCTALLGAVVQQVAAANPLWPPIQRYEADGSLGSVAVSVPASFTQSQQGAAVSFRVQSTGSPACLTVVVDTRAGDSKLAAWYYSGSPPSLSNHDGYTQLDGGEGDSTAAALGHRPRQHDGACRVHWRPDGSSAGVSVLPPDEPYLRADVHKNALVAAVPCV